jgi:hypothetical protein
VADPCGPDRRLFAGYLRGVDPGGRILEPMTKSAVPKRRLPTSPFKDPVIPPCDRFAIGDRVIHDTYGLGQVIGVEHDIAVLVDFGSQQERIPSPFSKMSHL